MTLTVRLVARLSVGLGRRVREQLIVLIYPEKLALRNMKLQNPLGLGPVGLLGSVLNLWNAHPGGMNVPFRALPCPPRVVVVPKPRT